MHAAFVFVCTRICGVCLCEGGGGGLVCMGLCMCVNNVCLVHCCFISREHMDC